MGSFVFMHPWLLAGLAAASLPILIHLIGRRRAPTVRFAAFDFLLAVNKRLARRERLRQFLLLLLRTLAIAALVAAISRPMPKRDQAGATDSNRRLVLVIDASASMGYRRDGTTLLDQAKSHAREAISHLQPGDSVALVIADAEVRTPFQSPTIDHDAARAAIAAIDEPNGVADLGAAIDNGLAQLGDDGAGAVLVVISDLSQNSFEGLRPSTLEPPPEVRLLDAASPLLREDEPLSLGNVAIESVRIEHSREVASERQFKVMIRNYGNHSVTGRVIELVIGGTVTHRGFLEVPARGTEEKILTHNFDGPGVFRGTVRLVADDDDGYPIDDAVSFVTEVMPGVRVLAVNGDPRMTPYEDELFFLERALQAVPRGDPPIDLRIVALSELADVDFAGFDVVLLANVGSLTDAVLSKLRSFVDDGGGLLFTVGHNVDFEAMNAQVGSLLPHPLRDLHREADVNAGTPPIGIGGMDWDHAILAGLGMEVGQSLRASRTSSYFNLGVGSGIKSRAVLRFENGAPALIERRSGPGRVMMLTTSIDIAYSDIALRSAFPPLIQRTVRYLADAVASAAPGQARAGGTVEIALPTGARGIALISPLGVRREVKVAEGSGRRAVFRDIQGLGFHTAEVLRDAWSAEARLDIAVNPFLEESDFMPVSAERVSEALGGDRDDSDFSVLVGAGAQTDPFEARGYGSYLLIALCLFFVGESLLASRG